MNAEFEKRVLTAARIANYGLRSGLLPYQVDEAVGLGMARIDAGDCVSTAYKRCCKLIDEMAQKQILTSLTSFANID